MQSEISNEMQAWEEFANPKNDEITYAVKSLKKYPGFHNMYNQIISGQREACWLEYWISS